ncbi:MAG: hypothetical protein EA353_00795 [Puniceicoccaceae bacterium]|nr:MAG: hypothetical protein EA353_00795 [Puniceicoccaceae bacterium]
MYPHPKTSPVIAQRRPQLLCSGLLILTVLLAFVGTALEAATPRAAAVTEALVQKIKIEDIRLQDTNLKAVLGHLEEILEAHVPEELMINLTLADEAAGERAVNLRIRNVTFSELLDFISLQTRTAYRIQGSNVIFGGTMPPDGLLETAIFPVSRGAMIRMTGAQ